MIEDVTLPGKHCTCDVCSHQWNSIAKELPKCCPNTKCRSREWNGKKTKRKPQPTVKIKLPKPRRSRIDYGHATDNSDIEF